MAAFQGMHVSPAKQSYAWLPRKCDFRTDAGQSDSYVTQKKCKYFYPQIYTGQLKHLLRKGVGLAQ